jgi:hypothetical protein
MRSGVTIALAVYLTGLGLTIAANSGSGSSPLLRTVKSRLFAPWMVPAWLDLGFDRQLTYGLPDDADHELVISARGSASAVRLPDARRGEQAARWRRLARAIAVGDGAGEGDSVLAAAVGRGSFDDVGAEDVTVRVRRPRLAAPPGPVSLKPLSDDAFVARVRLVGGEVQLVKAEARGEVAPLAKPRSGPITKPSAPTAAREGTP